MAFLDLRLRQRRPSPNVHPRGKSRGISLQISAHFFEPDNNAHESRTLEGHDMHREAVVIFTVTSDGPLTQGEDLVLLSAWKLLRERIEERAANLVRHSSVERSK